MKHKEAKDMHKMILGAVAGAIAGYAWYRLVGCATGSCPLTSNPYISALYGAVMGLMLTSSSFSGGPAGGKPERFQRLAVAQAAQLAKHPGTFILDVRTPQEYAEGRLAGAVLLPVSELSLRLGDLPKDKTAPMLVYCAVGPRAEAAARLLTEQGYTSVNELKGGITAWKAEGQPVVR